MLWRKGGTGTPELRAVRDFCGPPAGAARGRGAANPSAHLQPGRTAGMAGFRLLSLALALLLLARPSDSSVILACTGRLVEGKDMAPGLGHRASNLSLPFPPRHSGVGSNFLGSPS